MKKTLSILSFLFSISAFSNTYINPIGGGPVTPEELRLELRKIWDNNPLIDSLPVVQALEQVGGEYKAIATCTDGEWDAKNPSIFYVPIYLGIKRESVGPITKEYMTFDYMSWMISGSFKLTQSDAQESFKRFSTNGIQNVKSYFHNFDGGYFAIRYLTDDAPIDIIMVKPIAENNGFKFITYIGEPSTKSYSCIL